MNRVFLFFVLIIFLGFSCTDSKEKPVQHLAVNQGNIKYPLPHDADSLLALLKTVADDTNKINVLNTLSWQLKNDHPDSARLFSDSAFSLANHLGWKKGIAVALSNSGVYYYDQADYTKALECHYKALAIDSEILKSTDKSLILTAEKGMAIRFGNIGVVYGALGNYPKALECYLNAMKIDEEFSKSSDKVLALFGKNGVARHLGNIGTIYSMEGENAKALEYYLKAIKLDEETGNKSILTSHLENIGNIYDDKGEYATALEYYFRTLEMIEQNKFYYLKAGTICNIGIVYFEQGDQKKASEYYLKALQFDEEQGDKNSIATDLSNIGSLYFSSGKYKDAYDFLLRAQIISDTISSLNLSEEINSQLSDLFEKSPVLLPDSTGKKLLNKEEMRLEALRYFKNYMSLRDSIFSQENKKQLVQKELNYEFARKEAATKADQDKKDLIAKAKLSQKEKERNYFIVGFSLVILLAGFIFRGYRQKQKTNEIISRQKLLVEEKQKEMLDSIHYAKKIQQSLLPTEKYIAKNLNKLMKAK